MKKEEALGIINDRLKYVANIYGRNWRDEKELLEICRDALESEVMQFTHVEDSTPPENAPVLVKVTCTWNDMHFKKVPMVAEWHSEFGWTLCLSNVDSFYIHEWHVIPNWE